MHAVMERVRRDTSVSMRIPQQTKELIEAAAQTISKSFSAFVIDSARQHAVDVLLDQKVFTLSVEASAALMNVLDNPPAPTEKLRSLMQSKSPWEA